LTASPFLRQLRLFTAPVAQLDRASDYGLRKVIFPSIVISRFSKLLKVRREIRAALRSANDAQSEMAKALQWIVDNWKIGDANIPHPPPPPPI
jgi:hypothetical protein